MSYHEQGRRCWAGVAFGAALLGSPALGRTVEICNTTSDTVVYALAAQSAKQTVSFGWESLAASACKLWATDAEQVYLHGEGGTLLWEGATQFCMNTENFVNTNAASTEACRDVGDYRTGFIEIPILDRYTKYKLSEANAENVQKPIEICNQSPKNVYVAVGYYADRGPYLEVAGWSKVATNECKSYSLPNTGKEFYVALDSTDMAVGWRGDEPLCVNPNSHFTYRGAAHRPCTDTGHQVYRFIRVPVGEDGTTHYTAFQEAAIKLSGW